MDVGGRGGGGGNQVFASAAPHLWNRLPKSIHVSESVDIFKSKLKTHFRKEYFKMKEHLFRTFNLVSALSILWMEMSVCYKYLHYHYYLQLLDMQGDDTSYLIVQQ